MLLLFSFFSHSYFIVTINSLFILFLLLIYYSCYQFNVIFFIVDLFCYPFISLVIILLFLLRCLVYLCDLFNEIIYLSTFYTCVCLQCSHLFLSLLCNTINMAFIFTNKCVLKYVTKIINSPKKPILKQHSKIWVKLKMSNPGRIQKAGSKIMKISVS